MRTAQQQSMMDRLQGIVSELAERGGRKPIVDAALICLFNRGVQRGDTASQSIAGRVLCLLDVCPMTPKEMGRLLGIDSERAVFKNALTSLRKAGMVVTEGSKRERLYRLAKA